jgi:hypothetical protein
MAVSSSGTLAEILDRILDKGTVETNEELQVCCPDCIIDGTSIYVLASVETYLKFAEAYGNLSSACCTHLNASVETTLKFYEAVGSIPNIANCPTNFNECLSDLKSSLTAEGIDRILDKGIVEYGSLSGQSQLCRFNEFVSQSVELDIANTSTKAEVLDRLLDKGVVISCTDGEIIMASVETWLKWNEALGNGGGAVPAIPLTGDTGNTPVVENVTGDTGNTPLV